MATNSNEHYVDYDRRDIPGEPVTGTRHVCATCGLSSPFEGFDDCLQCAVSYEIHEELGATMDTWRRLNAGTDWLAEIEREYARQTKAIAEAPHIRLTMRQAS